jgi:hypothetical protein
MKQRIIKITGISAPILISLLAATGCGEDAADAACGAELRGRVDALRGSVSTMSRVAGEMRLGVATACKNIAVAGGQSATVSSAPTDQEVEAACTAAEAAISAKLSAVGSAELSIVQGECRVSASAQVDCEGKCEVTAGCTEPDISVRCEPGKLSVQCSGECTGAASCEATANVKAQCEGTCSATCEGTCSGKCVGQCQGTCSAQNGDGSCNGTCTGTCTGQCDATCEGTCTGKCQLAANADVNCTAEARCEGSCSGTATAPECEGELTPPKCTADADCQANCQADAQLKAECTPPSVQLVVSGSVDATFVTALETNLTVLVDTMAKANFVGKAAIDVASNVGGIVNSSATCAAALAAEIRASAEAAASISASVRVSASASGSVSGGS